MGTLVVKHIRGGLKLYFQVAVAKASNGRTKVGEAQAVVNSLLVEFQHIFRQFQNRK